MATIVNEAEQIITLSAGDEITRSRMAVQRIILRGTAAGTFVITFGNTSMSVTNSSTVFMVQLDIDRSVNYIKLVSGPTGAIMYVMLEQKR